MDQIYPDNGLVYLLQQMVGNTGLIYDLFINDVTPTLNDTPPTYTIAAWSGYASIQVNPASWTLYGVLAHLGSIQAPTLYFANSSGSPQVVYGYVIWDPTKTYIVGAARFDGAPVTIADGASYSVVPILGDFSALSS